MPQLRIAGIVPESVVDGPGFRYTVFTQGCRHNCPGCHNPQTHDFGGGHLVDTDDLLAEMLEDPLIKGMTFSGGDPFEQPAPLADLARKAHGKGKDIMVYTGYTFEQLLERAKEDPATDALLRQTDILIDGPFILAQRNLELRFRGSDNQRVIDVPKSLECGEIVTFEFE
jgi:anaerobic ribonucleoside-triphosphate reductase activating protein